MKTKLREWLTRYRCFIRPKVHCSPEFSFNALKQLNTYRIVKMLFFWKIKHWLW